MKKQETNQEQKSNKEEAKKMVLSREEIDALPAKVKEQLAEQGISIVEEQTESTSSEEEQASSNKLELEEDEETPPSPPELVVEVLHPREFLAGIKYLSLFAEVIPLELVDGMVRSFSLDPSTVAYLDVDFKREMFSFSDEGANQKVFVFAKQLIDVLKKQPKDSVYELHVDDSKVEIVISLGDVLRKYVLDDVHDEIYERKRVDVAKMFAGEDLYEEEFLLSSLRDEFFAINLNKDVSTTFEGLPNGSLSLTQVVDGDSDEVFTSSTLGKGVSSDEIVTNRACARFSSSYLKKLFHRSDGLHRAFLSCSLLFANEHPLLFRCNDELMSGLFVLAPRVDND